ncbi:MAG: DUF362 domain-containing protein [Actinomycetota bacterium]|nr:DUF362 domain-containing protein [Actinomycetota bacterium]
MDKVVVAPIGEDIDAAVSEVLEPFGGVGELLDGRREVFIKVNAVDFKDYTFTDPQVLRGLIRAMRRGGAQRVYVMENCTQGSFTRLVFRVSGLEKAVREEGAVPLYLDEGKQVEVFLPKLRYPVHVSRWVKEQLIEGRDHAFYLNLPKMKTHSMATVTLGVKNQFGLIAQEDRVKDHNWMLHRKFADIYSMIKPHFTLIDGLYAVNHGHYPPRGLVERSVERLGVLVGGRDTLAVDAVGSDLMGIPPEEVEHLRLAAEDGMGTINLDEIEVIGDREPFRRSYTCELLPEFPPDVKIVKGEERCCREGCRMNTLAVMQMLYVDFDGKGGFTICMGKGFDPRELECIKGSVLLVGDCAVEEAYPPLSKHLGKKAVRTVRGCNNLRDNVASLAALMGVNPLKMVPLPPLESVGLLLRARLNRTTARIAPLWAR